MKKMLALVLILILAVCLCACTNKAEDDVYIYVSSYDYNKNADTVTATISFTSSSDESIAKAKEIIIKENGAYFNKYYYTITAEDAIWQNIMVASKENAELKEKLTQSGVDNVYNLKIDFVYATIYQSIKGDGTLKQVDENFIYTKSFSDGDLVEYNLSQRVENRAAWYGSLIAICIVIFGALSFVVLMLNKKEKNTFNGEKDAF